MKAVVTGGGSGGHVYPAIAIADKFKERDPDCEILYIGYMYGLEKTAVPKAGYELAEIDTSWIDRSNIVRLAHTARYVLIGIRQATKVLKKFRPDFIIGTGGFVCYPVILSGRRMGIPCYIHEQNAFPGLANRRLEKYVNKIFLGFEEGGELFKDKDKLVVTGNPVRSSFFKADKAEARKKLGIPEDDFVVLSFGGSLGAPALNTLAMRLLQDMNGKEGQTLVFGTGKDHYENVKKEIEEKGIDLKDNIWIKDYIDDMDSYIAAADLIISRAGALSVAETLVSGKASILVPSPNVTGNHQFFNAKAVADKGGAILAEEKDLDPEEIVKTVNDLRLHPEKLEEMGRRARELAPVSATDLIYEGIVKDLWKNTNA